MAFKPSFEISDQGILASLHNAAYTEVEGDLKDKKLINTGCEIELNKLKTMLKKYDFGQDVFKSKKGIYEICIAVQIDKIEGMTKPPAKEGLKKFVKNQKELQDYIKANEKVIKKYFDKELKQLLQKYCTTFGGKEFANAAKDVSKLDKMFLGSLDDIKTKDYLIVADMSDDVSKAALAFKFMYNIEGNA